MTSVALSSFLQSLLLLGSALTALKLYTTGLYKKYPVFFFYFVFRIPNNLSPLVLDFRSNTYFFVYLATLPIMLLFYVLMVRELYRLVLEDYRGLQTAGRWAMYISLVCAVAISIATVIPKIRPSMPQRSKVMGYVMVSERGTQTALALFILVLLFLLSRYPIRLSRNVRVHAVIYSVFFLSGTITILARTVLGLKSMDTWNLVSSAINLACVSAWLILLSPVGEKVGERKIGAKGENERRLLLQLEGINAALLRISRSKAG